MNDPLTMFGKQKAGLRRLAKEAAGAGPRRSRGGRKARATSRARDFLRVLSLGLSANAPALQRYHD